MTNAGGGPVPRAALAAWSLAAGAAVALARSALLRGAPDAEREERLGTGPPPCGPGRLLLHAVSAGEAAAAGALVAALGRAAPERRLLLTAGTREGRSVAERVRAASPNVDAVAFLPWDRPRVVREWLARLAPAAVVTVEAELWPGLFLGARALGIPVAVASGRLRPGEARRYALARPVFRAVAEAPAWIGARTEEDRARFVAIGAPAERVEVTGDLKVDAPVPRPVLPEGWEAVLSAGPPLVVAGSTHPPEERVLLDALRRVARTGIAPRLVLAPRRVARAEEVARLARAAGLDAALVSGPPRPADVVVVDRFGLLDGLWPLAAVAFVGGTLAPVGGHSPVGAAEAGVPLLAGPSLDGVGPLADALRAAGALAVVPREAAAEALARELALLLGDAGERLRRGGAARSALASLRGAADRTAARLLGLLG